MKKLLLLSSLLLFMPVAQAAEKTEDSSILKLEKINYTNTLNQTISKTEELKISLESKKDLITSTTDQLSKEQEKMKQLKAEIKKEKDKIEAEKREEAERKAEEARIAEENRVAAEKEAARVAEEQKKAEQSTNLSHQTNSGSQGGSVVLANGNTAGATGLSAAQEMARRTGQPVSVWEEIIAHESNGDMYAGNPSGASGMFQTMPFWGDTSTVEGQINAAERAYNEQGLGAWYDNW